MYRLLFAGLLVVFAGCQNIAGPFAPKPPVRVDDPLLPISEQKRLGREYLALPDENTNLAPQAPARPGLGYDKSNTPGR
jgi:hypothetical protein